MKAIKSLSIIVTTLTFLSCSKEPSQIGAGKSIFFDGDTNYFNIPATATLNAITGAITLEAWVKPKKQYYNSDIAKGQSNFFMQIVTMRPSFYFRNLIIDYSGASEYWGRLVALDTIPVDKWSHVACTYSSQNQSIKIYINGELVHDCHATGQIGSLTEDLRIGARVSEKYPEYMKGSIDEVRLWNVERTPTQIRENMSKGLKGNENGLVGYWNCNLIKGGTTIIDLSGHNHNGLMSGNIVLIDSDAF